MTGLARRLPAHAVVAALVVLGGRLLLASESDAPGAARAARKVGDRDTFFVSPAPAHQEEKEPPQRPEGPVRLTLQEALARARASSPTLGRFESLQTAAGDSARAVSAQRAPAVDVSGSYTRQSHVPELVGVFPLETPPGQPPRFETRTIFPDIPDLWRARVGFQIPLYTSGRLEESVAAARAEERAATADLGAAAGDLDRETVAAFWRLVAVREDERTLRESIAAYDSHLKLARDREAAGLVARNEVLAVQVERDRAEVARLEAVAGVAVAVEGLARLTGVPPGVEIEPVPESESGVPAETSKTPAAGDATAATASELTAAAPGTASPTLDRPLEDLLRDALAARHERNALRERAEAARARARSIRAGGRLQSGISGGFDYANPNHRILPMESEWDRSWEVGVGVSMTVFDGGRTAWAASAAEAQAAALEGQAEELDRAIRQEVVTRAAEWTAARAARAVSEEAITSARENHRVASDRYAEGLIPSAELLDSETALLRAGFEHTNARVRVEIAEANLLRAIGARPEP